jgi:hypothetical protein
LKKPIRIPARGSTDADQQTDETELHADGFADGFGVGPRIGAGVGPRVGTGVGPRVGTSIGAAAGAGVGATATVGTAVDAAIGAGKITWQVEFRHEQLTLDSVRARRGRSTGHIATPYEPDEAAAPDAVGS